jgi:hypothetical protein
MKQQATNDANFISELENAVRAVLKDKEAKRGDRLKAIEVGTKLLAIRHKIDGGDDAGSFFAKPG